MRLKKECQKKDVVSCLGIRGLQYAYAIPFMFVQKECYNLSDEVKGYLKELFEKSYMFHSIGIEICSKTPIKPDDKRYFLYVLQVFYKNFDDVITGKISLDGDTGLLAAFENSDDELINK